MRIAAHRLRINNPNAALDFYQNRLGMTLIQQYSSQQGTHYRLAFDAKQAALELIYHPDINVRVAAQPCKTEGYWKFSIAVDDLDATRRCLIEQGVRVGECLAVKGLAYLCHLTDPDGYCIELIQKTLQTTPVEQRHTATGMASLNLSSLRVKHAQRSIDFYRGIGMKLAYSYRSEPMQMELFFLVSTADVAILERPSDRLIEEQLWQFPHTILELQQRDGTKDNADFSYRVTPDNGFLGLELISDEAGFRQLGQGITTEQQGKVIELVDPDGYRLRVKTAHAV